MAKTIDDELVLRLWGELINKGWRLSAMPHHQELEKDWRRVKQELENAVGRDICPECGSLAVVPILYGLRKPLPGAELWGGAERRGVEWVNGGCIQDSSKTRHCLDCGKGFLGNFDKWRQAYIAKAWPKADDSQPDTDQKEELPGKFIRYTEYGHCSIELRKAPQEQKWFVIYRANDGRKFVAELGRRVEAVRLSERWVREPPISGGGERNTEGSSWPRRAGRGEAGRETPSAPSTERDG